jgi:hypothetical protein
MPVDWPHYQSHRIVQAARIVGFNADRSKAIVQARKDGPEEEFAPSVPAMLEKAEINGFAMHYDDGFRSIIPQAAFESGYRQTDAD